ncbi:hypothetical protein SLS53_004250 [Cytospora paraplurivora]|uniref:Pyridoxamine 5'-phosphate oxidase Alr4036 family FMN-binding domain-containing protein n=1 Tax=Cytospora paraplurivora TaxID=2898453 RepID=A0AAN9YHT4_9PEZI
MASLAATAAAAPWRAQFLDHISKMDQQTFTLTTQHPINNASVPRARTCVLRGLWTTLPPNDRNKAPRNPPTYESDALAITTDARMEKVAELFASGEATGRGISSSGGGGPVEALFWVPQAQTQWRIRGHAWVLSPSDVESGNSGGAKAAREALSARMRRADGDGDGAAADAGSGEWSWEREVVAHFGNLSPAMRGGFKNPPPGTPRSIAPGPGEGVGQTVGDELLEDEVARRNFRVVVIVPDEVDLVDLSDRADQRRWLYTYLGPAAVEATKPGGEVVAGWEKVELWP